MLIRQMTTTAAALLLLAAAGCGGDSQAMQASAPSTAEEGKASSLGVAPQTDGEPSAAPFEPNAAATGDATNSLDGTDLDKWQRELEERERRVAARESVVLDREAAVVRATSPSPPTVPAATPEPAAPEPVVIEPEPQPVRYVERTLPAGTVIEVELERGLSSEVNEVGDRFAARVIEPIDAGGVTVVPLGSAVTGRVTEAKKLKKIGGRARLGLAFESLQTAESGPIDITGSFLGVGRSETKKDAATIGGATAAGVILGRVIKKRDKTEGGTIGGIVGAAVGSVVAAKTDGEAIELPAGSILQVALEESVTLSVVAD